MIEAAPPALEAMMIKTTPPEAPKTMPPDNTLPNDAMHAIAEAKAILPEATLAPNELNVLAL